MVQVTGTYTFEIDEDQSGDLIERARRTDQNHLGYDDGPYSVAKAFDVVFRADGLAWMRSRRIVIGWGWNGDDAPTQDCAGTCCDPSPEVVSQSCPSGPQSTRITS